MKMRALDSFYSAETGHAHAGQEFVIDSAARGEEFAKRGLATIIEETDMADDKQAQTKQESAPKNKAEAPAANKTVAAPATKAADKA